jgi:hypothetical protein
MNSVPSVKDIIDRLKQIYHTDSDTKIADILGMSKQNLSIKKNSGAKILDTLFERIDIDDFIFAVTGKAISWDAERKYQKRIIELEEENKCLKNELKIERDLRANEIAKITANIILLGESSKKTKQQRKEKND